MEKIIKPPPAFDLCNKPVPISAWLCHDSWQLTLSWSSQQKVSQLVSLLYFFFLCNLDSHHRLLPCNCPLFHPLSQRASAHPPSIPVFPVSVLQKRNLLSSSTDSAADNIADVPFCWVSEGENHPFSPLRTRLRRKRLINIIKKSQEMVFQPPLFFLQWKSHPACDLRPGAKDYKCTPSCSNSFLFLSPPPGTFRL